MNKTIEKRVFQRSTYVKVSRAKFRSVIPNNWSFKDYSSTYKDIVLPLRVIFCKETHKRYGIITFDKSNISYYLNQNMLIKNIINDFASDFIEYPNKINVQKAINNICKRILKVV